MKRLYLWLRRWYYRRKVVEAARTLQMLDKTFTLARYTRQDRRRFWRNLVKDRDETIKILNDISFLGPSMPGAASRVGRGDRNK